MRASVPFIRRHERLLLASIVVFGLCLRLWALGDKGLAYDEAATALMARATPAEIVAFHWDAAFEHPPFWQLTMRAWSHLLGQSETLLRLLPALAGAMAVLLTWGLVYTLWPAQPALRLLSAALVAGSPVLVLYSQEARMYTVVVMLALLSLLALADLLRRPGWAGFLLLVVANWLMVGYHYYTLLLVAVEGLFVLLLVLLRREQARHLGGWLGALLLAVLPIALWMLGSPGFRETFAIITAGAGSGEGPGAGAFIDSLWRDLSFGAIRWQPATAAWGYLLAPLAVIGLVALVAADRRAQVPLPWCWLVVLAVLVPLVVSAVFFRSLAARYILFILPMLYLAVAAGILWLWRRHRVLGGAGLAAAVAVAAMGLFHYFGAYQKSEYRTMAAFLTTHKGSDDAVMLYAPRQHLLARYYMPDLQPYFTAPAVELPPYWPFTAPQVVPEEMDGQLQQILRDHPALWLVITAANEVDPGEFVPKYLTAVAYKEECWVWLDVQLCRFVSPEATALPAPVDQQLLYNGELRLVQSAYTLVEDTLPGRRHLLARLDWLAEKKPSIDYRVTLRLLDGAGAVVAQRDEFPIGTLLPPTTWNGGDAKPGYMALPLADELPPGAYRLIAAVYNPVDGAPIGEPAELGAVLIE